ncbi:mitochondrial ribosomal protein S25-domain-containing protein [Sparassis latifolia]|uniref:Small ribosomal subunit protein mS23 n=1 Tax=Sparassis crispa TaxID=139825 RepID=A0A401G6M1_9APHY|nr:37S ribosomal protein S25, mitochondrial [Sparassis crispa]GBE77799.1 37S ribosomal protein S25, mitochondrial [Sparassis crispa]
MSKRVASQVHKQASRLLRQNYLRREPLWYQAVLDHPPLPLPAKNPPPRTNYDLPTKNTHVKHASSGRTRIEKPHPLPVQYVEDEIRRQFFRDHPFEAFRPTTLLEGAHIEDEHPIQGKEWTRLRQRGRNPTPEDAIRYAANLHLHHDQPLTNAYTSAVAQFRSLRSEQHIARSYALLEADYYGLQLGPSQVDIAFEREGKALETWEKTREQDANENAARKRWKAIVESALPGSWTKGQEYVRLWQEGIRPTYAPLLTERTLTRAGVTSTAFTTEEKTSFKKDPFALAEAIRARA